MQSRLSQKRLEVTAENTVGPQSVWVFADVDFVARFPSNRRFFRQNRRISRIVLRGNATSELSASATTKAGRKK